MTDVFLERQFEPPLSLDDVGLMAADSGPCFDRHRIRWNQSFLSSDGGQLLCWFTAPDAEAGRVALRAAGADVTHLWPGTVHDAPGPDAPPMVDANVVVTRRFDTPVSLDDIQAIEDAGAWCLETYRVKFVRTFFSLDRRRMICLYRAPDAESVRQAQRQAEMPVEVVWAFRPVRDGDVTL